MAKLKRVLREYINETDEIDTTSFISLVSDYDGVKVTTARINGREDETIVRPLHFLFWLFKNYNVTKKEPSDEF